MNIYAYVRNSPVKRNDPFGLYSCTYDVSEHRMTCTPNDPGNPPFDDDRWVSGNNSDPSCPDCQNNPDRINVQNHGPVVPGSYGIGAQRAGSSRRNLDPSPQTQQTLNAISRGAFQTHGCSDPATCSNGCIAATTNATRDEFNRLMSLETDNSLQVVP